MNAGIRTEIEKGLLQDESMYERKVEIVMKYIYTFSEVNYGRIEIEANCQPDQDEIINQILEGNADYYSTVFTDFDLIETARSTPKKVRTSER